MKSITTCFLLAFSFFCNQIIANKPSNALDAHRAIAVNAIQKRLDGVSLIETHAIESPGGYHYTYIQTFEGIPIFNKLIKVNMGKTGKVWSFLDESIDVNSLKIIKTSQDVDARFALVTVLDHYGISENNITNQERHWYNDLIKNTLEEGILFSIRSNKKHIYVDVLINEHGVILHEESREYFINDTTGNGFVFFPDPITSAQTEYGGSFVDNDDADNTILNAERVNVTLDLYFDDDTFYLENDFLKLVDFDAPTVPVVKSLDGNFVYTRSQDGFEDVNVFYHITAYQKYVYSLGFSNLIDTSQYNLIVDPHGFSGADQSSFTPVGTGNQTFQLRFGEGGVDDGEDADVIVHEFGHALSFSAAPNTNSGNERRAMDEGVCDYFAASYSRSISEYDWDKVFNWDGHNEFFSGRSANTSQHYPDDLTGNIHLNGQIWASALMSIWDALGRETTDSIVFQYLYSQSVNLNMDEAAQLVIQADSMLNGGRNSEVLHQKFCAKGLLDSYDTLDCEKDIPDTTIPPEPTRSKIIISNTSQFMAGTGDLYIVLPLGTSVVDVYMYNLLGQQFLHKEHYSDQSIKIESESIPPGAYIIHVQTDFFEKEKMGKIIKFK